ncbi:MAG: tetratricopeptide repeat protein, partial [Desulfobulbia bacterium]
AYSNKGQFDEAISNYDRAIQLNPKNAAAYYNRGIAYAQLTDSGRAIADFTNAIKINKRLALAYAYRSLMLSKNSHFDRAISDYRRAISLDPQLESKLETVRFEYWHNLAVKKPDQAVVELSKVIRSKPNAAIAARAYNYRCMAYRIKGKTELAKRDSKKAFELASYLNFICDAR